ncbi:MAG: threonylcarbamoyl-AMP synthase, partial [Bdellovibrionales bacterium]|nr:threonylcarbamoyl-AMP synthase [Bdellovibrionales bacterium]
MAHILPISPDSLQRASDIIHSGGLVAFPTETVYGLGADAFQEEACKKIYAAKGRPKNNPLIVHTYSFEKALSLTALTPNSWQWDAFHALGKLWPAPLTLVVPAAPIFPSTVTAGLPTVALRVPQSQAALAFLRAVDVPIAAPSANRSSYVSPTMAQHVAEDLGESVELILDGGDALFGLESTIVSLGQKKALLLRPGAMTFEELKEILPELSYPSQRTSQEHSQNPLAPGQLALHYSPNTP